MGIGGGAWDVADNWRESADTAESSGDIKEASEVLRLCSVKIRNGGGRTGEKGRPCTSLERVVERLRVPRAGRVDRSEGTGEDDRPSISSRAGRSVL